jgi:hypothetical protein
MAVLVDTSVWSLAYRRDTPPDQDEVAAFRDFLAHGDVVTTGMIYLELLRGFTAPGMRSTVEADFDALPFVTPTRLDYAGAADLSVTCRRGGMQLGVVDALLAQLAIARDLTLLITDRDFQHAAAHIPLRVWHA